MAIIAGFERCRGERVVTLDADLQNPPEEIGKLLAAMDRGPRLRRRRPPHARGFVVAPLRVEGDEPAARAHHPHPDDRPGLHAARLQPRHRRRRSRRAARSAPSFPALAYTFAHNPTEVEVAHEERAAGESKYSLYKLIRLNFDLITGFSLVPLQLFSMFGMLVSARRAGHLPRRHRRPAACSRAGASGLAALWDRDILAFFLIGMMLFGARPDRRVRRPHLPAGARRGRATPCRRCWNEREAARGSTGRRFAALKRALDASAKPS